MKVTATRNQIILCTEYIETLEAELPDYCRKGWRVFKQPYLFYSTSEKVYYWKSELRRL